MDNVLLNIIDDFLEVEDEEKEVWKVKDDLEADWVLDRLREIKAEYNRSEMVVQDKIQQLQHYLQKEKKKADSEIEFFESKLREYFKTIEDNAKDTKTQKSYKLPSGTLKLKKSKVDFDYDKDKLVKIADKYENMEDYIKTKKDFDWAEFKKQLEIDGDWIINKETGEIVEIDGLELKETDEKFSVEV